MLPDFQWLSKPTTSHARLPEEIKRRFPIVNAAMLVKSFVKMNRSPITLVTCKDVSDTSLAISFLLGAISAGNEENFKIIIAQKTFTNTTINMIDKLAISSGTKNPLKMHGICHSNDESTNILIATYSNAVNYIEEARSMANSQLTHIIIEGFDGHLSLDIKLLFRALQLSRQDDKFRLVIVADGIFRKNKYLVDKLCGTSIKMVNLLNKYNDKRCADRDIVVFDPISSEILQVKNEVYQPIKRWSKGVNIEQEKGLSHSLLNEHVRNTAALLKHFLDDEKTNKESPFIYVIFTSSLKVTRMVAKEIKNMVANTKARLAILKNNKSLQYLKQVNRRVVMLVSQFAEDAFALDGINVLIDMGLTCYTPTVSSIGNTNNIIILGDGIRMIRRANRMKVGTVAYPFSDDKRQLIRSRNISYFPVYDLDMRDFHENKEWSHIFNDKRTNRMMKKVEDISIRAGLISIRDPRLCTPIGSFCCAVLPMISLRLAKLVLCGIVCGCEDAAIALVTILNERKDVFECWTQMNSLMNEVHFASEHLAMLHSYHNRYDGASQMFRNCATIKRMESTEKLIRTRIKKESNSGLGTFTGNEEMEKRLLLAIAMSFGDRVGYARNGDAKGETRFFYIQNPDNNGAKLQFESRTKFIAGEENVGIYYELKDKENLDSWIAEITYLPVTLVATIGNIGGNIEKFTDILYLTTNTGGIHIKMDSVEECDEIMEMRNEVEREVERVALSYLQSDRYVIEFKNESNYWMDQLIPLLTPSLSQSQ